MTRVGKRRRRVGATAAALVTVLSIPLELLGQASQGCQRMTNGACVAIVEKPQLKGVVVAVSIEAGSASEQGDELGAAHLLEHLMFREGTDDAPPGQYVLDVFALGGIANAFTTKLRTTYLTMVPASQFGWALRREIDRLFHLRFAARSVAKEKPIVEDERQRRALEAMVTDDFEAAVFADSAMARPVSPSRAALESLSIEKVDRFYRRCYRPEKLRIIVLVPSDMTTTLAGTLRRTVEAVPARQTESCESPSLELGQPGPRQMVRSGSFPRHRVEISYSVPKTQPPAALVARVVMSRLSSTSGRGGTMATNLQATGVAIQFSADVVSHGATSVLRLVGIAGKATAEELEAAMLNEIEGRQLPLAPDELERIRSGEIVRLQRIAVQPLEEALWRVDRSGDATDPFRTWSDALERLTRADVERWTTAVIRPSNRRIVVTEAAPLGGKPE